MGSLIESCDKGLMKFLCGRETKSRLRVQDKDKWISSDSRTLVWAKVSRASKFIFSTS